MTGVAPYNFSFDSDIDLCYRVFGDHMRAAVVALADGVLPQTKYVNTCIESLNCKLSVTLHRYTVLL